MQELRPFKNRPLQYTIEFKRAYLSDTAYHFDLSTTSFSDLSKFFDTHFRKEAQGGAPVLVSTYDTNLPLDLPEVLDLQIPPLDILARLFKDVVSLTRFKCPPHLYLLYEGLQLNVTMIGFWELMYYIRDQVWKCRLLVNPYPSRTAELNSLLENLGSAFKTIKWNPQLGFDSFRLTESLSMDPALRMLGSGPQLPLTTVYHDLVIERFVARYSKLRPDSPVHFFPSQVVETLQKHECTLEQFGKIGCVEKFLKQVQDNSILIISWKQLDQWSSLVLFLTPPCQFCIISSPPPTADAPHLPLTVIHLVSLVISQRTNLTNLDDGLVPKHNLVPFEVSTRDLAGYSQTDAIVSFIIGVKPCTLREEDKMRVRLVLLMTDIDLDIIFPSAPFQPSLEPDPAYACPALFDDSFEKDLTQTEIMLAKSASLGHLKYLHRIFRLEVLLLLNSSLRNGRV